MLLLCAFMLQYRRCFLRIIIVRLGLKKLHFIFYCKEMIGNSSTNHWLDMDLRRHKEDGYLETRKLHQTFSDA